MDKSKEIYFGDKNTFAIRYLPEYKLITETSTWYYAFLHLQLNGQLIGSSEEACSVLTWLYYTEGFLETIKDGKLIHEEFIGKKDDELFELIWKANQFEEDFNPAYAYLPQLDGSVWRNCHLDIDETIDAYLITTTQIGDDITFIWQGWREPCHPDLIDKLFSLTVHKHIVIKAIEDCLEFVKADLINYSCKYHNQ